MEDIEDVKIAVVGNVNAGKCLARGTMIMLHNGSTKAIEKVKVGDFLMGDNSTPRTVLSTTHGKGQLYDVIPRKGDKYTVNGNHILALKASNWDCVHWDKTRDRWMIRWLGTDRKIHYKHFNTRESKKSKEKAYIEAKTFAENVPNLSNYQCKGNVVNITVKEYLQLPLHLRNPYKGYRVGVEFPSQKVTKDPYILGYWLGDGTSAKPQITTADKEIIEIYDQYAKDIGCRLHKTGNSKYSYNVAGDGSKGNNIMLNSLKKYNLLNNKHIPDQYKYNSRRIRMQLLAGLIDSDGYYSTNGSFDWCQKSEKLFDDTLWLVKSLGFAAYKKRTIKHCVKPDGSRIPCECYTMSIVGDLDTIPTKIARKRAPPRKSRKDWLTTGIKIEESDYDEFFGFELDGNQQFLLADFTVTHNSSLIGTLIRGKNDNGRGANREVVMNYKHEKESGQTSSIGYQILGFRTDGTIIHVDNKSKKDSWPKIIKETKKLVSFMDLAGHEKYLKTTIHGISCNHPDYALILVEGKGVRGMTREHIMLALSFEVPFIILITKADLYRKESVAATIEHIGKIIKSAKRDIWVIRERVDMEIPLQKHGARFVPVFTLSNVTGEGMDLFKEYLFRLPKRIDYSMYKDDPFEMAVLESFVVTGVGTVAHGFLARGTVRKDDVVWVGPDSTGNYHKSKIRTIHFKRLQVEFVLPGHLICINLPNIDRKILRQGVYVLHEKVANRMAVRRFTADVRVLTTHPITIECGYCPILNMDNIRMAAQVLKITTIPKEGDDEKVSVQECLRGGGKARIEFKFSYFPAYLRPNASFVFREGKTRGFGKVVSIDLEIADGGLVKLLTK